MKIANKIILSFLVTAVILTGIGAPTFYITAKKSLEGRIYSHLETTAQSRAHHIETFLEEHKRIVQILGSDLLLKSTLKAIADHGQNSTNNTQNKVQENSDMLRTELKEIVKKESHFHEIKIMTPDGKIFISTDTNNIEKDKSAHDCFIYGRNGLYIEDAHFCGDTKEEVIAVATPILQDNTAEILGVLVASVFIESLNEITTDTTGLGRTGEIYLVNKESFMITPSRFKENTFLKQKVDTLNVRNCRIHKDKNHVSRNQALNLFRSYRGEMVLGTHAYIPEMQWFLCSEMDQKEAFAPLAKIKLVLVIIMIFMPITAWLIGIFISRVISRPIRRLQEGTEIIGRGNLDYKVGMGMKDEIGQLSQAFDKMSADLQESRLKLEDSYKQLETKVQERTVELSSTNTKLAEEIAERKQAEQTLRESEEKMRFLLELLPDFIIIVDPEYKIQFINRAAAGSMKEEVIGKSAYDFIEPPFHKEAGKALLQTFATGQSCSLVARGIDSRGKKGWFENRLAPIKHNGSVEAVMVVSTEITKRRKADEKLKQSREFLTNTINALEDTFFVKDQEHRWTVLNDAACKAIGRPREELIGKTDYDIFSKEQANVFREKDNFVLETGETNVSEEEVTWQGKLHTISTKKSLFKDYITGKRFIVGTARDITEQKQVEEALREKEAHFRTTIENLPFDFFMIGEDGTYVFQNPAIKEKWGEIVGKRPEDIADTEEIRALWKENNRRAFNGEIVQGEVSFNVNGEKKNYYNIISPIYREGKVRGILGMNFDITERKKAERALHESEQKYRALVEQSMHGIAILQDFRVVFANQAVTEITGLTMEKLQNLSLEDMMAFIPPENRATIRERLKNRFAGKNEPANYELRLLRRNGEEFWLNLFFSNIEYHGKFAVQLAFTDITERKRAEDALRRSEKRFRQFFENTAVGVYTTTPDGQILMANPALVNMLGYPSFEKLSQRNLEEEGFEPHYLRSMFKEEIEHKGRIVSWESIWTTQDGKTLHVIENARAVRDNNGRTLYYEGTAENITERKKAEEALRESEQRYRAIFEQAADSIVLIDVETGELIEFNDRAHENLGYTREEFRNLKIPDFEVVESPEETRKHLENIVRTGADTFETKQRTKDGEIRDIQIRSRAISIREKDFVQSIWHDITERKRVRETLLSERNKLVSVFEAMKDGVYIVNQQHDIQYVNPILEKEFGPWQNSKCYQYFHDRNEVCTWCKNEQVFAGKTVRWEWYSTKNRKTYDLIDTPLKNPDGSKSKLEIFRDITERKQAEEKLKIREQTLRAFLNAPTESAILLDTEGKILDINRIAAQRLGKSAEELIGMGIYDYLPADTAEYRKTRGAEVIRSGKPLRFQDEQGGHHYDNNIYPVFDDEGKVSTLAVFSGDITEKKRAEERLLEYQEQLKSLALELTLAEERERHRIATDLHDEISQSLFISKMKVEALEKPASDKKVNETLDEISDSLGRIITTMRSLTFDLSSPILYEFGFEEAVAEWLTEQIEGKYGIETEFQDDGLSKPLDDDIRVLLFRNVRELLINVVKHANAKIIKVSIQKVESQIRVCVEDDGVGFDSAKAESMITNKKTFGLFSIRERLEHLGGNLEIESAPGCGCRITITSPLS